MNSLAIALIKAQSQLIALQNKMDKTIYTEKQLKRFDRLEKEIKTLSELFWQSQVPIHTIDQYYGDKTTEKQT